MDTYTPLLEKTRVPQPSLQKYAVISIFEKLRLAPPHLGPDSDAGREAITYCLSSKSPSIVDQAVRELCRLVKDSKLDISRGLLEIQSSLEGCDQRFVSLFVKAIGFLLILGFQKNPISFQFLSSEVHPFLKVISCRTEGQHELVQQVILFMLENRQLGMLEVCQFLRPFLNYTIVRIPVSPYFSSFLRNLVSSMASVCSSFPGDAIPVLKLLMGCVRFFQCRVAEDLAVVLHVLECISDAYVVVLRQLVQMKQSLQEVQLCGVELVEVILLLDKDFRIYFGGCEKLFEMAWHLLVTQKDQGLSYATGTSCVMLSTFTTLIQSKLEQEQLVVMKVLLFLLEWKRESGCAGGALIEDLLYIFPVINIVSSPCKQVKQAALDVLSFLEKSVTDLLASPEKECLAEKIFPATGKPEWMIHRLLRHMWFQDQTPTSCSLYLNCGSSDMYTKEEHSKPKRCFALLKDYCLQKVEERGSLQYYSPPNDVSVEVLAEVSLILGAIGSVFLLNQKLALVATDLLAVIVNMAPELGVSLFLLILFYSHAYSAKDKENGFRGILLKLLGMIPSLASQPAMVPLITQTVMPMLHRDAKPVLYATATRLVCKTWEINGRIFQLQELLLPKKFDEFASNRFICISMAASVRDVCRRNPDRGVDLVLSVASCIENRDPQVQSLGLQSLAHLCEADAIDFYTAWDVIAKHVVNYKVSAVVASSLCLLLRWGVLDAEAYIEASAEILRLLWEIGTSRHAGCGSMWTKTRATAFRTLCHFEVVHLLRSIPEFGKISMELFLSETDPELLCVLEELEARILNHEQINRRRYVKQKRVPRSRIEKLLDIFPRVTFGTGNEDKTSDLPGVALFTFAPKYAEDDVMLKDLEEVNTKFENAFLEVSASLQLSRNILIALISLQSWKPFMRRWMKIKLKLLDVRTHSTMSDKSSEAARGILKTITKMAEDCLPRSAENFALAVAALCWVNPPAHGVKSAASKCMIEWLAHHEHEYRQWTSAISLGLISTCLHPTDSKERYQNINALLEVACNSRSTLVKGACGIGLGLSCQDLLKRIDSEGVLTAQNETGKVLEAELVRKIVGVLSRIVCQYTSSSVDLLQKLDLCFLFGKDEYDPCMYNELVNENSGELEEDIWGIAGLVFGLGACISAVYRAGGKDAALCLKEWIFSNIACLGLSTENFTGSKNHEMVLSVGSCLSLPLVLAFCQRVELVDNIEVNRLLNGLMELISALVSIEDSGTLRQNLLMVACTGAGNLLSCVVGSGLYSLKVDIVKDMLSLFRKCYSGPNPPFVHFGGMLGVINALGANAGMLENCTSTILEVAFDAKRESQYAVGPFLLNSVLEPVITSLVQEVFLMAKNSDEKQTQQFAAWAISFLGHRQKEAQFETDAVSSVSGSQNFPEDSTVLKLSLWLMSLSPESDAAPHVNTVASVLRCLSNATRLPMLDWRAIVQRCMRYEDQLAKFLSSTSTKKGVIREECLLFSLRHANQFDSLLTFLEELADLTRIVRSLYRCREGFVENFMLEGSVSQFRYIFS